MLRHQTTVIIRWAVPSLLLHPCILKISWSVKKKKKTITEEVERMSGRALWNDFIHMHVAKATKKKKRKKIMYYALDIFSLDVKRDFRFSHRCPY